MNRFLFFGYRDWAIDLFKKISQGKDEYIFIPNKELCKIDLINAVKPDLIFFYGWSWFVTEDIVNNYNCLCLHPSKLPKYRGGSPIQNQIQNGEKISAVTIFKMGEGLDDGPIYFQEELSLEDKLDDIFKNIGIIGLDGTKKLIEDYKNNNLVFIEQDQEKATSYKRLKPANSEIKPEDFLENDAKYFYNKVRSLQKPYLECYIKCKTGKIIIKDVYYEI